MREWSLFGRARRPFLPTGPPPAVLGVRALTSPDAVGPALAFLPASLRGSDPVVFRAGARDYTRNQVLDAASFRLDLDALRATIRLGLAAEAYAADEAFDIDQDELQAAAERYRIDRDLSTAEDTERWLADHALSIDDFGAWLERGAWTTRFSADLDTLSLEYEVSPEDVEGLLWAEIVFGEHLPSFVRALSCRVAAACERGGSPGVPDWHGELAAMEAAFEALRSSVLQPAGVARELDARRSLLIRFQAQIVVFASPDVAREAWLCARDGEALDELAAAAGVECTAVERFLDEFPEPLQARVLSSVAGEVLQPVQDGDAWVVCHVTSKRVPETADDPPVRARIESALMERSLDDLVHRHVTFSYGG